MTTQEEPGRACSPCEPVTVRAAGAVLWRPADDGTPETVLRVAYFPPDTEAEAGPMCASPYGAGFPVRFAELSLVDE